MSKLSLIHVPKIGGSYFVGQVINLWPRELVSPHTGLDGFLRDPNPTKYHFTAGHVFYPRMKEILSSDREFMTIFRDPIQRCYSHWLHIKKFNVTKVQSFEELLYEDAHETSDTQLINNLVARYCGWYPDDFVGIPKHVSVMERLPIPLTDNELYEQALANLEKFWFIGWTDRMVEAVTKVYSTFNLPAPTTVWQKDIEDYTSRMSTQVLKDLKKYNEIDIALYKHFRNRDVA